MAADITQKIVAAGFIQRKYDLDRFELKTVQEIRKAVNRSIKEYLDYAEAKKDAVFGQGGWTRDKGLEYVKQLRTLDEGLKQQVSKMTTAAGRETLSTAFPTYDGIMSFKGGLKGFNYTNLSPEKLSAYAKGIPVGGKQLEEWMTRSFGHGQDRIRNEILSGVLKGESAAALTERIRQKYATFSRTSIETMVRTHVQSANNHAIQEVCSKNKDAIREVRWLATLDATTCIQCGALDGRTFKVNGAPFIPAHPRCRCVLLPITKTWKELGLDREELLDKFRPELQDDGSYKKVQKIFPERFKEMPEMKKLTFLGPGRYDFLSKSKMGLEDLVDPKSGRLFRLEELPKVEKALTAKWAKQETMALKLEAQIRKEDAKKTESKAKAKAIKEAMDAKNLAKQEALIKDIDDPERTASFTKGMKAPGFESVKKLPEFKHVDLPAEPGEFKKSASGGYKKKSSGVIVYDEKTDKVWIIEPTNEFGGYKNTFPKGTIDEGLSAQATAIKEVWEETGIVPEIIGYLGDYEKSTSMTRYYIGKFKSGSPVDFGWETAKVKLVPVGKAEGLLNKTIDKAIFSDFENKLKEAKALVLGGQSKSLKGAFLDAEKMKVDLEKKIIFEKAEKAAKEGIASLKKTAKEIGGLTDDELSILMMKSSGKSSQDELVSLERLYKRHLKEAAKKEAIARQEEILNKAIEIEKKKAIQQAASMAAIKEGKANFKSALDAVVSDKSVNYSKFYDELSSKIKYGSSYKDKIALVKEIHEGIKRKAAQAADAAQAAINLEFKNVLKAVNADKSIDYAKFYNKFSEQSAYGSSFSEKIALVKKLHKEMRAEAAKLKRASRSGLGLDDDDMDFNAILDAASDRKTSFVGKPLPSFDDAENAQKIKDIAQKALAALHAEDAAKALRAGLLDGVDFKDLTKAEQAQIGQLKMTMKYKGTVPKPGSKPMMAWNKLSGEAQEDILNKYVKKGGAVPDSLPLKEGATGVYIKPIEAETSRKFTWLKGEDYVKYANKKGSNEGGFFHHKNNPADRWYFKQADSDDIVRNEMLAGKFYEQMGVDVPTMKYVEIDGGRGIASKIIDGLEENEKLLQNSKILRTTIHENFVVDAFLANWDVVGMDFDNLMIKDGVRAIRIDPGGALRYRAMGGLKGKGQFGYSVGEIDSLRNAGTNRQSASVFKSVTQEEMETGAKKVLSLSNDDIKKLVNQWGPAAGEDKEELIDILIGRREDIRKRFPNVKIKKIKTPAPAPKDANARVTEFELKTVVDSRINGYAMPTDKDMIEDQQILFWHEKTVGGKDWRTGADFKVRKDAAKSLDKMVMEAANSQDLEAAKRLFRKLDYGIEDFNDNGSHTISEIMIHKGSLRKGDIMRAETMIIRMEGIENKLTELVTDKYIDKKHLDNFKAKYKDLEIQFREIAKLKEGDKYDFFGSFEKLGPIKPPSPKDTPGAIVWSRVSGTFEAKAVVNGNATVLDRNIKLKDMGETYQYFYKTKIDGVEVRYWPHGELHDSSIAFAHKGKVQMYAADNSAESMEKLYTTMKKLGLNTDRPTALDTEELYLRQIFRHRKDEQLLDHKKFLEKGQQERIDFMKTKYNNDVGSNVTDNKKIYQPDGDTQAFGHGRQVQYRPDILADKGFKHLEKNFVLTHQLSNGIADDLENILNGGGLMAPTTDKLRRGFSWGGMSPLRDMETGGGSFFFTRVALRSKAANSEGLFFKPRLLARLDAISYAADEFGEVTERVISEKRKSSLEGMKENAKRWSMGGGNETIFKKSLSVLGDIDHINANEYNYDRVINLFKKHKITQFPDGRLVTDVVRKIKYD